MSSKKEENGDALRKREKERHSLILPTPGYKIFIEANCVPGSVLAESVSIIEALQRIATDLFVKNVYRRMQNEKEQGRVSMFDLGILEKDERYRSNCENIKVVVDKQELRDPILIPGGSALANDSLMDKELESSFSSYLKKLPERATINVQAYDAPESMEDETASIVNVSDLLKKQKPSAVRRTLYNCLHLGNYIQQDLIPRTFKSLDLLIRAELFAKVV